MVMFSTKKCSACDESHNDEIVCEKCGSKFCSLECKSNHSDETCNDILAAGGPIQFYIQCLKDATTKHATETLGITNNLNDVCCYICCGTNRDGLVRNAECNENTCYVHISCLAKYVKSIADSPITDVSTEPWHKKHKKWTQCGICGKNYTGLLHLTMSCYCWDYYIDNKNIVKKCFAMNDFASGFLAIQSFEEALNVYNELINTMITNGLTSSRLFTIVQISMACCLDAIGQKTHAMTLAVTILSEMMANIHNSKDQTRVLTIEYIMSILTIVVISKDSTISLDMMIQLRKVIDACYNTSELYKRFYYVYALILYEHPPVRGDEVTIVLDTLEDSMKKLKINNRENDEIYKEHLNIFSKLKKKYIEERKSKLKKQKRKEKRHRRRKNKKLVQDVDDEIQDEIKDEMMQINVVTTHGDMVESLTIPWKEEEDEDESEEKLDYTNFAPDEFLCPITLDLMTDPVMASDGYTYERSVIEDWFKKGHKTSPKTNQTLQYDFLIPNYNLKSLIQEYKKRMLAAIPKDRLVTRSQVELEMARMAYIMENTSI